MAEWLARIRNWRSLTLYRSDLNINLSHTGHLYGGTIDWDLIESHWKELLRVTLAIQSGRVAPSWVLTRLNSYSRRNKLYRAFRELGRVFRTLYLLRWIDDDDLRRTVTHEANKVHLQVTRILAHHRSPVGATVKDLPRRTNVRACACGTSTNDEPLS